MLCLTLTEASTESFCQKIKELPSDIQAIECRFDYCFDLSAAHIGAVGDFLRKQAPEVTSIATIRRKQDGGNWQQPELERLRLLEYCCRSRLFSYVDIEEDAIRYVLDACNQASTPSVGQARASLEDLREAIICSFHSCTAFPENIYEILEAMLSFGTLVKIAVLLQNSTQQLKLLALARYLKQHAKSGFILMGMGEHGEFSRILYRRLGAVLSYVHDSEHSPAKGMLDYATMHDEYRSDLHGKDSLLFGIIGNPIKQTRSPQFHNRVFRQIPLQALYISFLVDDCSLFMEMAEFLDLRGFSVTIPFKRKIMQHLARIDPVAQQCKAVNTVLREKDGYVGYNTDYTGFLQPLRLVLQSRNIAPGHSLRAAVLGAGGASSAVVAALVSLGWSVRLYNRTLSKAESIAQQYPDFVSAARLDDSLPHDFDCIVQCTNIGMQPDTDASPIPKYRFYGHEIVYDIVHKPAKTAFLRRAEAAGCTCIKGTAMFDAQAAAQALLFRRIAED